MAIVTRLSGGLGNQMFQYAFGRALSIKHNVPLKLNTEAFIDTSRPFRKNFNVWPYHLGAFNINATIAEKADVPWIFRMHGRGKIAIVSDAILRRIVPWKEKERFFKYDSRTESFGPDVYLIGVWQSFKYFSGIESLLRKEFTLKVLPTDNIRTLMTEIKNTNSLCMFVRRGDFVGNKNHEVVGKEFYERGIIEVEKHTTIDKAYVFSDDLEWCKQNMSFPYPTMFVDNEYAGENFSAHMMLMSQCKSFIIPNSTFSWWGAWLSERQGKIVICPKQWFPESSIDSSDLVPKEWIRI